MPVLWRLSSASLRVTKRYRMLACQRLLEIWFGLVRVPRNMCSGSNQQPLRSDLKLAKDVSDHLDC